MIDNIALQLSDFSIGDFEKFIAKIGVIQPVNSNAIRLKWRNLRVEYYPDSKLLYLKNSFHKFYNIELGDEQQPQGNYDDFDRWALWCISDYLTEGIFERSASDFKVFSKFEYGVNVATDEYKPYDIIRRYQAYINRTISDFEVTAAGKGKPLGKTCFLTDYRIKFYDKAKEAGLRDINLMRYEIVRDGLKSVRGLLNKEEVTLQDLNSTDTWQTMGNNLLSVYDCIRKIPLIISAIPADDLLAIHACSNELIISDLKKALSKAEYSRLLKEQKTIYEQYNNAAGNVHNIVREKINSKLNQLMLNGVQLPVLY